MSPGRGMGRGKGTKAGGHCAHQCVCAGAITLSGHTAPWAIGHQHPNTSFQRTADPSCTNNHIGLPVGGSPDWPARRRTKPNRCNFGIRPHRPLKPRPGGTALSGAGQYLLYCDNCHILRGAAVPSSACPNRQPARIEPRGGAQDDGANAIAAASALIPAACRSSRSRGFHQHDETITALMDRNVPD